MKGIKKDWRYDINFAVAVFIIIIMIYGLITLSISKFMPAQSYFFKSIYERLYSFFSFMLAIYPAIMFKGVCPKLGSDKLYLNTANIPYSRKGLFIKGLKEWFVILPVFIVFGTLINAILIRENQDFLILYINLLSSILWIVFVGMIINLQFITLMIIHLSKKIKIYKIIIGAFIVNSCIVLVGSFISIGLFVNDTKIADLGMGEVINIILLTCFVIALIGFSRAFKDIENISR